MASSRGTYDAVPRTSNEYADEIYDTREREFKDKFISRSPYFRVRRIWRSCRPAYLLMVIASFTAWQLLFNNSYADPPPFAINTTDKIYIAANIVDEQLIRGPWGSSLKELVHLLGKDRVFVSIYGNPKAALEELAAGLECEKRIVSESDVPLDLTRVPRTKLPSMGGKEKVKRIAYLAEVRNMALRPLQNSKTKFDKVLFINDVFFTPSDVLRLLWGTNNKGPGGQATYKAACAADFVNSWKFYDTFATRDAEGFSIGVPLFPWFTGAGEGVSRADVLAGRDVRVKSCWGGMVSFDAKYFQPDPSKSSRTLERAEAADTSSRDMSDPVRFRSWQPEPYVDASECCLVHADILAASPQPSAEDPYDTGIYMNPFVRVSYSAFTHRWLTFTKRFERLFYPLQTLLDKLLSFPRFNPRRTEVEGQVVQDKRWVPGPNFDPKPTTSGKRISRRSNEKHTTRRPASWWTENGSYEEYNHTSQRGAYCTIRQLLVVKEEKRGKDDTGGMWDKLIDEVPPLGA